MRVGLYRVNCPPPRRASSGTQELCSAWNPALRFARYGGQAPCRATYNRRSAA